MQHALKLSEPNETTRPFADYSFPASSQKWNKIVLVGEAPGAEEARLGRPFVGRSGQLLDKILERAGIERAQCLIANVFRYQPPGNKIDYFFTSQRAATTECLEIDTGLGKFSGKFCLSDFASEIHHLGKMLNDKKPNIIIALGRTPLWALTGENGLLDKVGKPLSCRLSSTIPVIPTFHPSFILRGNWKLQDEWLSHFLLALKYTK